MDALQLIGKEALARFIRGASGEAGKLVFTEVNSYNPWKDFKENHILGKKLIAAPTVKINSLPISAVDGKRKIHVELDLELEDSIKVGGLQQAQASVIFPPAPPPVITQVAIHLVVSLILTASLKKMMDWISSKGDKGKPEPESSKDGNEKKCPGAPMAGGYGHRFGIGNQIETNVNVG